MCPKLITENRTFVITIQIGNSRSQHKLRAKHIHTSVFSESPVPKFSTKNQRNLYIIRLDHFIPVQLINKSTYILLPLTNPNKNHLLDQKVTEAKVNVQNL